MPVPDSVRTWLLHDSDASVRYRVLRELLDRPADDPEVVLARNEIGVRGWAAEILSRQLPDGQWVTPGTSGQELYRPKYIATNWSLIVLAELGADRSDPRVARSAELLLDRFGTPEADQLGGTDSEVCVTGNCVRMMNRFGYGEDPRVVRATEWLVRAQMKDGGWHCWSSESGTLAAWEALAALASIPEPRRAPEVRQSIDRGLEFFLERGLMHESDGTYGPWFRLHYPRHYYYDLLVGLGLVTALGRGDDSRIAAALDWLESKRSADGTWPLEALQPDLEPTDDYLDSQRAPYYPMMLEFVGRPSRWITTDALVVLRHAGRLGGP
jgi:hypothetical protein